MATQKRQTARSARAEQLAKARNSDLVVLIPRQDDNSAALRERAESQLGELTERAQIQEIPQSEFRNVLEGSECALLVIPHDSELLPGTVVNCSPNCGRQCWWLGERYAFDGNRRRIVPLRGQFSGQIYAIFCPDYRYV